MKPMRVLVLLLVLGVSSGVLSADDESDNAGTAAARSPRKAEGKLINLEASRAAGRIDELQRRLSDLERDNRYLDDRIRALERTVDDLRRSR